ncbi:hypothetical protein [Calothrix sp. NIES-2100]
MCGSQWENLREIHPGDRISPNKLELKFIRAALDPRLLQEVGDLDT